MLNRKISVVSQFIPNSFHVVKRNWIPKSFENSNTCMNTSKIESNLKIDFTTDRKPNVRLTYEYGCDC